MKKTIYFISSDELNFSWNQKKKAIDSAVEERDLFLNENNDKIGKIDQEDIKIISNNQQLISVIIKLSYYPK
jgi:hypothetical protein